jgi:hypothetical protein
MQMHSSAAIIAAAVAFLYAIPVFIHPQGTTPLGMVSAVFAGVAGLALIALFIIRIIRSHKDDKK